MDFFQQVRQALHFFTSLCCIEKNVLDSEFTCLNLRSSETKAKKHIIN